MNIRNAIISETRLGINDHNILDAHLILDYGEETQGFGGYALYLPESYRHHSVWGTAGHFIFRCLQIAGVEKWAELRGKAIRVKQDCSKVHAIGHILNDDWFNPSYDFKDLKFEYMTAKPQAENSAESWQVIAEELAERCYVLKIEKEHLIKELPAEKLMKMPIVLPSKEAIMAEINKAKQSIKDKENQC